MENANPSPAGGLRPDLPSLCVAFTELAPLPMATVEGATHIVRYANPAFGRLMTKPIHQLIGKPLYELLPDNDECMTLIERVFQTKSPETYTQKEPTKPLSVFWSYTVWPAMEAEGLVGIMILVTETAQVHGKTVAMNEALILSSLRQHELTEVAESLNVQLRNEMVERGIVEESLRLSEERYRMLFNSMDEAFCIIETILAENRVPVDYRFLVVNPGFYKQTGLADVTGKTVREILPEIETDWIDTLGNIARTGEPFGTVKQIKALNGRWLDLYAFRVGGTESSKVAIVFKNITEQRRATETIRFLSEASVVLGASLDQATILYSLTHLVVPSKADWAFVDLMRGKSVVRLAIAHADRALSNLAEQIKLFPADPLNPKYPPSQALFAGRSLLIPEFTEELLQDWAVSPEHEQVLRELKLKSIIAVPLMSREKVFGVLSLATTDSGRRFDDQDVILAEELARRASAAIDNARLFQEAEEAGERLAAADRDKDEFLAMLAHELRNPLVPIQSAAQILGMKKIDDPVIIKVQAILERQASHMIRLVNDLMDTSRIKQRKVTLQKQILDLASVVFAVLDAVDDSIRSQQHVLTTDITNDPPLYIEADPARLAQIVSNLLINAAKYTPKNGAIHISVSREEGMAVIRVRDNGIGIEAHMLKAIFGLFTQVNVSLDRSQGGLGLGLKLVKELAELQGGTVEAQSAGKDKGSEFIVRFPEAEGVAPSMATEPVSVSSKPRQILLIDDNMDILESMELILTMNGHSVETASDGTQGLEKAFNNTFDIALVDIGLPDMNGYEIAQKIREKPACGNMVLIAVSGYGQKEDKRRALSAGFDGHMTKPVDADALEKFLSTLQKPNPQVRSDAEVESENIK